MADESRGNGTAGEAGRGGSESTATVRQELAATRARMSGTIAELEQRVSSKVEGVKRKVDVVELVKQHPWPSLAVAFVAGIALSTSGADRRAARATAQAAKRAPGTAKQAARATASGVTQLASKAVDRVKGSSGDGATNVEEEGGLRAKLRAQVRELGEEVNRGAEELGGSAPPRRAQGI
jgi:ElaB/YqjD/DUF883 family membrane-anchored ribosome-binding protein